MPCICYVEKRFQQAGLEKIKQANEIIEEYQNAGYELTLRQLYYQFVARGLIPNNEKQYDNLGSLIADARLAGLVDWDAIVDRTRYSRANSHWDDPADIVKTCSKQFQIDKWKNQAEYIECWIEKDALIGVIENVCQENDVRYMSCRGYASASEIWRAGRERLRPQIRNGKQVTVLYLGDHDPSGIDMTRDIRDRLRMFAESDSVNVERLALNFDQVEEYQPPPNPTKLTDSRAPEYIALHGHECWELDALSPTVIGELVQNAIDNHRDVDEWVISLEEEKAYREELGIVAGNWKGAVKGANAKGKK